MAWKPIIFAGCGPGAAELVTPATWMAALSADRLLGPPRLLDLFPGATSDRRVLPPRFNEAMAEIARAGGDGHAVTILLDRKSVV